MRRGRPPSPSSPNSSASSRSGVTPAALMATNSPRPRELPSWISRAASSLPAPGGPAMRMRLLVGATREIMLRSCWAAAERPLSPSGVIACVRRRRFSRLSAAASSARSTTSSRRSDLKGFSRKS